MRRASVKTAISKKYWSAANKALVQRLNWNVKP
jgi:hypothetical protein